MPTARDIGDELYALVPAEFTATRDRFAAEARDAGDQDLAKQITAMRRPTVSAWLVNLLALRARADLDRLLEVGEAIRAAQGNVPPGQLRDLTAQRRRALDAALGKAEEMARNAGGSPPGRQHVAEAESTLAAAMADETAAELVRSARVVRPLTYSGFGVDGLGGFEAMAAGRTGAGGGRAGGAGPERGDAPSTAETATRGQAAPAAERERQDRRRAAEERLADAERARAEALRAEQQATHHAERLAAEINDLRERLDRAQHEARLTRQRRMAAERDVSAARRRLDRLT